MCFRSPRSPKDHGDTDNTSKEIEKAIRTDREDIQKHMKLLLLGTGDAGKSTFAKQMKLVHQKEYALDQDYVASWVPVLRDNCLGGMRDLLTFLETKKKVLPSPQALELAEIILSSTSLTPEVAKHIATLWDTPDIRPLLLEKADSAQLQGGLNGVIFYLDNAERFADPKFLPTKADILAARLKTSGITETIFTVNKIKFTLVDVGGQRSERKKWLHVFGSVASVIFLAALNEFNLYLEEDGQTNRLVESLKLWKALSSSQFFKQTPFILFLNKSDIFEEKIKLCPLKTIFSDYAEFAETIKGTDFEKGWRYIGKQFQSYFCGLNFYTHVTNALDTEACAKIFVSVRETLLQDMMGKAGFM